MSRAGYCQENLQQTSGHVSDDHANGVQPEEYKHPKVKKNGYLHILKKACLPNGVVKPKTRAKALLGKWDFLTVLMF